MRAVGCLPDGSGPWVTANLNGGAASLAAPRPLASLLGPFCGWIKEAHVGRPQSGWLAHEPGMFCLFLVDVKKEKEKLKGGWSHLAPSSLTLAQNKMR